MAMPQVERAKAFQWGRRNFNQKMELLTHLAAFHFSRARGLMQMSFALAEAWLI